MKSGRGTLTAARMTPALAFVLALVLSYLPAQALASPPPTYGEWSSTGSFTEARDFATAAPLPNGDVLLAGGKNAFNQPLSSTEIYNPITGTWTAGTNAMDEPRDFAASAVLPNGDVLVAGGHNESENEERGYLKTAEIYDPFSEEWTVTSEMNEAREGAAAASLPDGDVLVVGGESQFGTYLSSVELYDPFTGEWTGAKGMNVPRERSIAVTLPNGEVLVAGGENGPDLAFEHSRPGVAGARIRPPGQGECGFLTLVSRPQEDHPYGAA